jgi:hypothetical protein
MAYERAGDRLAPAGVFYFRLFRNLVLALVLIAASLAVGMWGYHTYEGDSWLDAFADASMILSGMGPLGPLSTPEGKLFAGCYALYSGLFLVATASLILAPILHRFLHRLHAADEDENPGQS